MLWALAGKLLLAASKLKCLVSHSPGSGKCCGCTWHSASEEGDCCNDVWYVGDYPCPSGTVYLRWGQYDECCGCLPEQIFDPRVGDLVNTKDVKDDLCCPFPSPAVWQNLLPFDANADFVGCIMRCCKDGACTDRRSVECVNDGGQNHNGFCAGLGCPADCCAEDHDGNVTCETIDGGLLCVTPRVLADPDCATGCKGQCCTEDENGIYQPQGMMTQADCEAMDGKWAGLGKEDCNQCPCREPFDCACCESVTSTAAGITFTQPRRKRSPQFTDTFRVTVTGRTESSIYIHGVPVGASCDFEITFLLCGESFNVEPIPCNTNFKKLNIKVCWAEEHTSGETLNIRGCEKGTIAAGSCRPDGCNGSGDCTPGSVCTTTLLHDEDGAETSASIQVNGRLTIDSSGTGPLVLTGDLTVPAASCSLTIVVTGTNDDLNRIDGDILQAGSNSVTVEKRGPGTWGLAGANTHTGQLRVLEGTLVVLADVDSSYGVNGSPFGKTPSSSVYPVVGGDASNTITAAMLLADGVTIERAFTVAALDTGSSQAVVVGGRGSGASSVSATVTVTLERDVTLQAGTGGTVTFFNGWTSGGGTPTITVGTPSNSGTVVLTQGIGYQWPFVVIYGTAKMGAFDVITSSPVTVASATLDLNGTTQSLPSLTFSADSGVVTGGTLDLGYDGQAAVTVNGTGNQISSAVTLSVNATITTSSSATITISGAMSGAATLTFDGSGTATLSAASTRTGTTTISGGTVNCGDDDAFGTGGITVATGGTLNLNGHTIPNTITNNGGTVIP